MINSKIDRQIEEAIKFLVFAVHKSGENPKPVILHSIRVGFHLSNLNHNEDIVIAGILHDIIEDTNVGIEEVESKFGARIAELVEANSFDKLIQDKTERYKENFKRCYEMGKDALVVKTADFFDNIDYYNLAPTQISTKWLFEKLKYFIDNSQNKLKDEIIYKELIKKYTKMQD
ncbi:MAG: HD domain-containing protein [Patescibacteria group bacterium]|nr:HD domain-containing protein [Patescibacteria group bacterium]